MQHPRLPGAWKIPDITNKILGPKDLVIPNFPCTSNNNTFLISYGHVLGDLKSRLSDDEWQNVHLVMAGGYDERVAENHEHYEELVQLAEAQGLTDHVTFLRSFSDAQKLTLLDNCTCLLYTPSNEHFGIVPIESMYMSRPVIAVNSGGPLETVAHKQTGFLCEANASSFAGAMERFVRESDLRDRMGRSGKDRVLNNFSFRAFGNKLEKLVKRVHRL